MGLQKTMTVKGVNHTNGYIKLKKFEFDDDDMITIEFKLYKDKATSISNPTYFLERWSYMISLDNEHFINWTNDYKKQCYLWAMDIGENKGIADFKNATDVLE